MLANKEGLGEHRGPKGGSGRRATEAPCSLAGHVWPLRLLLAGRRKCTTWEALELVEAQ